MGKGLISRMLILDGLRKQFDGAYAVNNVSFGVDKGDVYGFLGPNGAGTVSYTHLTLPTKA